MNEETFENTNMDSRGVTYNVWKRNTLTSMATLLSRYTNLKLHLLLVYEIVGLKHISQKLVDLVSVSYFKLH